MAKPSLKLKDLFNKQFDPVKQDDLLGFYEITYVNDELMLMMREEGN